ncbi:arabinose ABC transporter permease [Novosphingobium sp. PC22D]|uniref:MFS transporter n=1 Tax=Novosphingobium sp. PC22D TaxID=1962403 RepID=UPI000BEF6FC0|nr:MFS transporter [Novosphingobium sp. PC22D]PEQ13835.1 arabinose ABC transporter permease [Novosphingobium sp. PC22D]
MTAQTSAERDARDLHAGGPAHKVTAGEIAIGVVIGRTSEFFDFFVYAIASVLVFPSLVFPFLDPLSGTIASFAVFALAFLARPFGTAIFTAIDRAYGRGAKLTVALFLLGGSTAAIAFLPGYEVVGMASVLLLALFRMGQGVALGGSWDGLASLLAMNAPDNRRGWYAMLPQLGAPLGLIVASLLFVFLISALPAEDFLDWGWRYPFFVAFAINVVALFARLRIVVTPEYLDSFEQRSLRPATLADTARHEWRTILMGAFAPLASFALFHMVTVFPLSWIFLFTEESPVRFLMIEAIAACFGIGAILVSGKLADRYGRRSVLGMTAVAIAAFSGFAPQLLDGGTVGETVFMLTGFILVGLSFGQSSGALSSRFAPRHRYTGSSLTSDFAWLFGAGFAPLAALLLSSRFGIMASGAYLLSGAIATGAALWLNRELARTID